MISDKTRPVPNGIVLPPILRTLEAAGIARERIEILVATGLHRANTRDELIEMTSADDRRRAIASATTSRATPEEHVHLGRTRRGTEIWLDRGFMAADLKIVTGLIEPHLMAGYSGGRKGVAPGLAGVETMRSAHGPTCSKTTSARGSSTATRSTRTCSRSSAGGVDFLVECPSTAPAGSPACLPATSNAPTRPAWRSSSARCASTSMRPPTSSSPRPAAIRSTTPSIRRSKGSPARSTSCAAAARSSWPRRCPRASAARTSRSLLRDARSNDEFMARITSPGFFRIDQWMVQHLCQVLRKAEVMLVTRRAAGGRRLGSAGHAARLGGGRRSLAPWRATARTAHVAVLPQGPYVLATVRGRKLALGRAWMDDAA